MTWDRDAVARRLADAACARHASRCVDQDARQESEARRRAKLAAKRPATLLRLVARREHAAARGIERNARSNEAAMRRREIAAARDKRRERTP